MTLAETGVGTGQRNLGTNLSWSDTIPAGTNYAVIYAAVGTTGGYSTGATATIDGASCTLVSNVQVGVATYYLSLLCFVLVNPTVGASKTVSISIPSGARNVADVVYYSGVTSADTPITQTGASATVSQAISSSDPAKIYTQGCAVSAIGTLNTYSQTQRYVQAYNSASNLPFLMGDAFGNGGTLTMSAIPTAGGVAWGSTVLPLNGPVTETGTSSATAKRIAASFGGTEYPRGVAASVLRKSAAANTGAQTDSGNASATMQKAAADFSSHLMSGALTATAKKATASASGAQSQRGTVSITTRKTVAAVNAHTTPLFSGIFGSAMKKLAFTVADTAVWRIIRGRD